MLCLPLAVILLAQVTHPIRTAYVTSSPLVATLDRIFEKLKRLEVSPTPAAASPPALSDDEEELLSAMQSWARLTPDQLDGVAKDLQRMRADADEDRTERLSDLDYADMDDEEYSDMEYHNDAKEDEDDDVIGARFSPVQRPSLAAAKFMTAKGKPRIMEESFFSSFMDDETSSSAPVRGDSESLPSVTPSAFTRDQPFHTIVSAADPIAATNERPRIMDDSALSVLDRKALRSAALANMGRVVREGKCLVPQPRWLSVRQLAPASDTMYMPPCVKLHRCAPDSGCCNSETDVCAPIDGRYVVIPFLLHKADGNITEARMVFYNHTSCACVARDTLQSIVPLTHSVLRSGGRSEERQNDWRPPTSVQATVEPRLEEEDITAPPQMRRCTCPTHFLASMSASGACSCGCDWREASRRRDCLYLSRGKEHLGLRERVCIENGNCTPPICDYGIYDRTVGKCPKSRRIRYHVRRHHQEKNVV